MVSTDLWGLSSTYNSSYRRNAGYRATVTSKAIHADGTYGIFAASACVASQETLWAIQRCCPLIEIRKHAYDGYYHPSETMCCVTT